MNVARGRSGIWEQTDNQFYPYGQVGGQQMSPTRHLTEFVLTQKIYLRQPQRALIELVYGHHCSLKQLADFKGIRYETLRRELNKLIKHMLTRKYSRMMRHRRQFNRRQMDIGYQRFILSSSYRSIARQFNISQQKAKQAIEQIDHLISKTRITY